MTNKAEAELRASLAAKVRAIRQAQIADAEGDDGPPDTQHWCGPHAKKALADGLRRLHE